MAVQGLHLLITYKCNARCRHCFLSAGPEHSAVISSDLALGLVREAAGLPAVNHLFIEGGEPFLFPKKMLEIVKSAGDHNLWIGALSNGFWAHSRQEGRKTLEPLVAAGLQSLSISTDAWHREFIPGERARMAFEVARELGLEADIMMCGPTYGRDHKTLAQEEAYGDVVCRGRAAAAVCASGGQRWETLTKCPEKLTSPRRVHIGPSGEIHLCQGLLLGAKAGTLPLGTIFSEYRPEKHPLVSRLAAGGPRELARFAQGLGWKPRGTYADPCHLCYSVRVYLRETYPTLIGPPEIFAAASPAAPLPAKTTSLSAVKTFSS